MYQSISILKLRYLYASVLTLGISACCKGTISHETYYENKTEKTIRIEVYNDATPNTLILNPHSITNVESPFIFGDSILVYSADILTQVHYPMSASAFGRPKMAVKFTDTGSLYDLQNYHTEKIESKCGGRLTKSTYAFNK